MDRIDLENVDFRKIFKQKGYAYFTDGVYNLNIIGIRKNTGNLVTNLFDDFIVVTYNIPIKGDNYVACRRVYPITTEPGLYYMNKPLNKLGAAILVPGQYRGAYTIGKHKGKYPALIQKKPVKVFRDDNKDNVFDLNPERTEEGIFGLNIHRSAEYSVPSAVDKWSAGCQVFQYNTDFVSFMGLCTKQKERYGNSFTYTLIEEKDLNI